MLQTRLRTYTGSIREVIDRGTACNFGSRWTIRKEARETVATFKVLHKYTTLRAQLSGNTLSSTTNNLEAKICRIGHRLESRSGLSIRLFVRLYPHPISLSIPLTITIQQYSPTPYQAKQHPVMAQVSHSQSLKKPGLNNTLIQLILINPLGVHVEVLLIPNGH